MKKILFLLAILSFSYLASAQTNKDYANEIVKSMQKADTKENRCYTSDGQEGRLRTTSTTTTTTYSNTQGSSYNSGSRSQTTNMGSSIGTNTSASNGISNTYNSGNSSSSSNRTQTTTTTETKTCVPKSQLPLYNH